MKILESKRNKKIAAGTVAGVLLITLASCSVMNKSKYLVLANTSVEAELGQKVSTNVADYLDTDKVDNIDKVIRDTKQTDNIKYVTVDNLDENGKVVSKEEKDYPEVGKYEIKFTYKKEKATVKVTVKDTTKPSTNSGSATTKPSDSQATKPSSSNNTGSTSSSKPGSTDSSSNKPSHTHNWQPQTKTVHHDEVGHYETKTVQNAYDEPITEWHEVCKVCKQDFGKGQEACDKAIEHSVDTGHSYESKPVQVGTKHHDAVTQQVWVVDKLIRLI